MDRCICNEKTCGCIKTQAQRSKYLTAFTITGVLCGIALGFGLRELHGGQYGSRDVMYVKFVGEIFLRMLRVLVIPLIVSSVVAAIASLNVENSCRIWSRAIFYFFITTAFAVFLGIVLVIAVQPGHVWKKKFEGQEIKHLPNITSVDTMLDLIRNMFPQNLVEACISQYQTVLKLPEPDEDDTLSDGIVDATFGEDTEEAIKNATKLPFSEWDIGSKQESSTNVLGLVVFSMVLGITLGKMGPQGKPLLDLFTSLSHAMMFITNWLVCISPVGICFLIAGEIVSAEPVDAILEKLGMYIVTVILGLLIHGFVVLPFIYGFMVRRLPFRYIFNMVQALAMAFGTAASFATLPVTIGCVEKFNGVDPNISRFVLPLGATINMDGTALYEAVAAIFIAQVHNVPITAEKIVVIGVLSAAASVGAAGISGGGLVTMVMVLNAVGLPAEYIAHIIAVDWIIDRFRTTVNIMSDAIGAGIIHELMSPAITADMKDQMRKEDIESLMQEDRTPGSDGNLSEQSNPDFEALGIGHAHRPVKVTISEAEREEGMADRPNMFSGAWRNALK